MLYKMRCPVCGSHFAKLDLRTQTDSIGVGPDEKQVEVVVGLCPECNSVLGMGGALDSKRSSVRNAA